MQKKSAGGEWRQARIEKSGRKGSLKKGLCRWDKLRDGDGPPPDDMFGTWRVPATCVNGVNHGGHVTNNEIRQICQFDSSNQDHSGDGRVVNAGYTQGIMQNQDDPHIKSAFFKYNYANKGLLFHY